MPVGARQRNGRFSIVKTEMKWIIYGVVPLVLSTALQAMYFSGNLVLQRLACPKLPPLSIDAYREFGLVENVQNLLILGILITVIAGAIRSHNPRLRLLFGALACFSTLVLLEEIDYGAHLYAYLTAEEVVGWFEPATSPTFQALLAKTDFGAEPFNLHNRGDLTDIIKNVVSGLILALFVVAPFYDRKIKSEWLRYFMADRFALLTVVTMVLMRLLTRELGDLDSQLIAAAEASGHGTTREVGSMNNNLSEFREVLTYYLFFIYLAVLVFLRKEPQTEADV